MSRSLNDQEFASTLKEVEKKTNVEFMAYFKKYKNIKEKWVFGFKKANKYDSTNLHIESWHRVLKYTYLKKKRNKRADKLIATLLTMSDDSKYKQKVQSVKGLRGTFHSKNSARHNACFRNEMILEGNKIQVL